MTAHATRDQTLDLPGLDGANPLAFLAALGMLRMLTLISETPEAPVWVQRGIKMGWMLQAGAWTPRLHFTCDTEIGTEDVLSQLIKSLSQEMETHPATAFMELDNTDHEGFRQELLTQAHASTCMNRQVVDWLSALCSEQAPEATSQLQTVRRDYFLGNLRSVMNLTEQEHLRRCLFAQWDYKDPLANQSLHLDPGEDRRHAYQWHQPTSDPTRSKRGGMLGANRLAMEAFPLFQSIARGDALSTRGFTGNRSHNTRWSWPIWAHPLDLDVVGSLLALQELQLDVPDSQTLHARGVVAVFRCRRILVGKTPNFTPSIAVV